MTVSICWQAALAAATALTHANPVAIVVLRAAMPGLFAAGVSFEALMPAAGHPVQASGVSMAETQQPAAAQQPHSGSRLDASLHDVNGRPRQQHQLQPVPVQSSVSYLQLVSVPQSWAAVLAPCCRAVCGGAARSWRSSGIRLPW